ncbi:MAG: hypothetical protein ACI87W_002138 [Halieaceae bacterium]|jgi:hypothetical protein
MKLNAVLLATTLLSGTALAACDLGELQPRPHIPDGQAASFEQMQDTRIQVVGYLSDRKAYLECPRLSNSLFNRTVRNMERTAGKFNRERETYLQKQLAVAAS